MTQFRHSIDCSRRSQETPPGADKKLQSGRGEERASDASDEALALLICIVVANFSEIITVLMFERFEHCKVDF